MEDWEWKKFFDVSPQRFGKDHAILFRLIVIVLLYSCAAYGVYSIVQRNKGGAPVSSVAPSRVNGDTSIASSGGDIATMDVQSTASETRSTSTTVTNMPFANGILGVFGSMFKTQSNEERANK